jgi:N-acetylmuramoyl-L-alanine amidase
VRWFQQKNGLQVDGQVGDLTLAALGMTPKGNGGGARGGDLNLLARLISAEARGEPYEGQVAVGAVVLNRVKSSAFPNSISGVIYQKGAFSAVDDGQINLTPNDSALKAAKDAMNGWDPTGGCLYYYNPDKTSNRWIRSRPVVLRIGSHVFCK